MVVIENYNTFKENYDSIPGANSLKRVDVPAGQVGPITAAYFTPQEQEIIKNTPFLAGRIETPFNTTVPAGMYPPSYNSVREQARQVFNYAQKNYVNFLKDELSSFARNNEQDKLNAAVKELYKRGESESSLEQTVNAAYKKANEDAYYASLPKKSSSVNLLEVAFSSYLPIFAPVVAPAIGVMLGLTGTAAAVVGSAIVQGTLAEAQGGEFLDGAIKGAVSAGVNAGISAPIANTVGTTVADLMADSVFKDVVSNVIASSTSSAVTAALTGGDVSQAAITGAVAGGAGSVGREIGTAAEYGTTPFSEQTQTLASQDVGMAGGGTVGAQLGQALGAIGAGADPASAFASALSKYRQEAGKAAPTSSLTSTGPVPESAILQPPEAFYGSEAGPTFPVSPPTGAEIASAPPPQTPEIVDTGVMGGVAETIPEITPPSTQEIPIPDQISQELGGVQEGVAGTIPPQDQQVIDLITQPEIPVAQLPEVVITAPREEPIPGIQEGMSETIPDTSGVQEGIAETIPPEYVTSEGEILEPTVFPEVVITAPREEPIPGIQEGIAEGIPEDLGVQEGVAGTIPEDLGLQEGIAGTIPEDLGLQEGIAGTIPEEDTGVQEGIAGTIPETETVAEPTPYIQDTYISGGRRRGDTFGPTVRTLGQALAPPLFPSAPVSGLTSYRGAGEIEGKQTGKPRRDVWNEASLRLKDALGL